MKSESAVSQKLIDLRWDLWKQSSRILDKSTNYWIGDKHILLWRGIHHKYYSIR